MSPRPKHNAEGGGAVTASIMHTNTRTTPASTAYLNKHKLADHLGVSVRTIDSWKVHGVIPFVKVGRVIRYKADAVESALGRFTVNVGGAR